jgi:glutamyl-tRNA synthetase
LGNLRSALLGWLDARSRGGEFLLRVEDLDPERSTAQATEGLFEDLAWLGLDWDGPVWRQAERAAHYARALEQLRAAGRVYPCWCSRAEVARAASAPHAGEDGPVYPGTCRRSPAPRAGRAPSQRFAVEPGLVSFDDGLHGRVTQDVSRAVGDFVVQRADGVASYQLAVVVDDAASGITEVIRGDDLIASTPRQLQLYRALGATPPRFTHVPLLLGPDGQRLAKRAGAWTAAALRERGARPEAVIGLLARWSGLTDGQPISARELVAGFTWASVGKTPTVVTPEAVDEVCP